MYNPNNDFCDVSEFFENIEKVKIEKYIVVETNEVYYLLIAFPSNNHIWLTSKEFVTSKLRDILDQHQFYLKPSIASKNRSQKLASLYQKLSIFAQNHFLCISRNPGFHMVQSDKILFFSSENSPFIQNSNIHVSLDYNNWLLSSKRNYKLIVNSVEAAFLLVMRCLSMFMSLNAQSCGLSIHFPYLLVFSHSEPNSIFLSVVKSYLCAFNRFNPNISDINLPYKALESQISQYQNNVLLLNAMTDSNSIRDENLNLLRDHYINTKACNLCAVISNAIQAKINRSEYLELNLDKMQFLDTASLQYILCQFDENFINTVTHCSFNDMLNRLTESYNRYLSLISTQFSQLNVQKTYASINAVKDFVSQMIAPESSQYFGENFENFVLQLFQASMEEDNDNTIVKMFRSRLEGMLHTGEVHLLENNKSNQDLPSNSASAYIYHEKHTLLIPADMFGLFCTATPLHVKRSLQKHGYLYMNHHTYVEKKVIYQPGGCTKRMDVYLLNDDLIDPKIIEQIMTQNRLQLSKIRTTDSAASGVILGNGIHESPIIWSYAHPETPNSHLFITGRSGTGKTTCIAQIVQRLCERGEQVVIFDISNSYSHHPCLAHCSTSYEKSIPVNPLNANHGETKKECCQRIASHLNSMFQLGANNYDILLDVLQELYYEDQISIDMELVEDLVGKNKKLMTALRFAERLGLQKNSWSQLLQNGKAAIMVMDQLGMPNEKAAEFLLNDLYRYMEKTNNTVFVVIDEIQNMISSDTSAVIKVLSQGREKGLSLISATQSFLSIPRKYKSMFLQSSLNLFFQPEITAIDSIAKLIHAGTGVAQVTDTLKKLGIAECLTYGFHENDQHQMEADTLLYCNCNFEKKAENSRIPQAPTYPDESQMDEDAINMELNYSTENMNDKTTQNMLNNIRNSICNNNY